MKAKLAANLSSVHNCCAFLISGISGFESQGSSKTVVRTLFFVWLPLEYQFLQAMLTSNPYIVLYVLTSGLSVFASHVNSNPYIVLYVLTLDYQFLRAMLTLIRTLLCVDSGLSVFVSHLNSYPYTVLHDTSGIIHFENQVVSAFLCR